MLKPLPKLAAGVRYLLKGGTLNDIRERLIRMVPIDGAGVDVSEGPGGMVIDIMGTTTGESALDFAATLSGSSCTVRAGKILHTDWSGWNSNDPANSGWSEEALTVAGTTTTIANGDHVWLKITFASTDADSTGPLSTADTASTSPQAGGGGGGGAGGGGGGGGGGNGAAGSAGTTGSGGLGGAGSIGAAPGIGGTDAPAGDGSPGASGGPGQAGASATAIPFYNYANSTVKTRRWYVTGASWEVATTRPVSDDTESAIRICSRHGTTLVQHQVGGIILTLPVLSYTFTP